MKAAKSLAKAGSIIAIMYPAFIILEGIAGGENNFRFVIGELAQEQVLLLTAAVLILGGGLAVIGTIMLDKRRVAAGILLLISAAVNFITTLAFIPLLLSGIYVLVPEKPMKIISMVLGIAGGVGALVASAFILRFILQPEDSFMHYAIWGLASDWGLFSIIAFSATLASGALGIAGGLLARKRGSFANTLMLIACIPNLFEIPFLLLLIGGILASKADRELMTQQETAP